VSAGDIATVVTAVITGVGVIIALLTYSYSVASTPQVRMKIGPDIVMHYDQYGVLIFRADFVFWNAGAQPGAISEISGRLAADEGDGAELALYWRTFEEIDVSRGENGRSIWWAHSTGPVYPVIVPGRAAGSSSVVKGIRLYQISGSEGSGEPSVIKPGSLRAGRYQVSLEAIVDGPNRASCSYRFGLTISETHFGQLDSDCRENKDAVWHHRLMVRRLPSSGVQKTKKAADDLFQSQGLRSY
jgi:hypothetical protein